MQTNIYIFIEPVLHILECVCACIGIYAHFHSKLHIENYSNITGCEFVSSANRFICTYIYIYYCKVPRQCRLHVKPFAVSVFRKCADNSNPFFAYLNTFA